MENTYTGRGRRAPTSTPPSLLLLRSRSGTSPETCMCSNALTGSSQGFNTNNSKSTTRSLRSSNDEENVNASTIINSSMLQKKSKGQCEAIRTVLLGFLQWGSPRNPISDAVKKTKSVTSSPSAWTLSPGRALPFLVAPESPGACARKVKSSGGISGVLKHYRQKKASPAQGEEFPKFRILHNTLLQYRFSNARTEAYTASLKDVAESERILYMLTELISTVEVEEESLKELDTVVTFVPPSMETGKHLRLHLIQTNDRRVKEKLTQFKGIFDINGHPHAMRKQVMSNNSLKLKFQFCFYS